MQERRGISEKDQDFPKGIGYTFVMPRSAGGFFCECAKRAWDSAKKTKTIIALAVGAVVSAASILLGIHWDKAALVWVPPGGFVITLLVTLFYHAYRLYVEAERGREVVAAELAESKKPKVELIGSVEPWSVMHGGQVQYTVYRLRVRNNSDRTVRSCGVRVIRSTPPLWREEIQLSVFNGESMQGAKTAELHPGDDVAFALCKIVKGQVRMQATTADVIRELGIYTLIVRVTGEGAPATEREVRIHPTDSRVVFYADEVPEPAKQ